MLAYGKLRLCLDGSRLHFPTENRQSRAGQKFLNDPVPASRLELFSKSSLSRPPQRAKQSLALQAGGAPDVPGGTKVDM
jgi:hypothetical protein